ncbi:uncharacterized protein Ecym_7058 [Eremothecium cymbalariae DBVPG|uniref:low-specificity L-threonine aldolase n=1 Tax=Eremothecium cymbalariae (strain CBS 270.75 / DBVPG 7215 / KCTC 17166 / NRRL Y-17582) TaxID=931890 RepID=G8JVP6_ERECY|nr:hypothetical protein Ecym_7058 [Eremothecium cymbalariae DBVPG\
MSSNIPPKYETSYNDYRSDTFTIPTRELWDQVYESSVGDTIYQEDTDTCLLETRIAQEFLGGEMYGGQKAAGLFCMSTTMSNQLAIRALLNRAPPYSLLCDRRTHVFANECAGIAVLSQALVITVEPSNGHHLTLEDIKANYIPGNYNTQVAPTRVISLENTLHGMCFPLLEMQRISEWAHSEGILLHLDGARLWNAVAVSNEENKLEYMKKISKCFDSISLCFTKSIGAPVGSIIVGGTEFIERARHIQKQQGGGLRQAGFLARIVNHCINKNFPDVIATVSNKTAAFWKDLRSELIESYGLELKLQHPVETNFIFIDLEASNISLKKFLEFGEANNVKFFNNGRIAFHFQNIGDDGLKLLKQVFIDIARYYAETPIKTA